jgi:hypothetical protein
MIISLKNISQLARLFRGFIPATQSARKPWRINIAKRVMLARVDQGDRYDK